MVGFPRLGPSTYRAMTAEPSPVRRRVYVPAVGKRLRPLLALVFALFALLAVNGFFLVGVRLAGWWTGETYENLFYLYNFLVHLFLGLLLIAPAVLFGVLHIKNAHNRPNRRAVMVGYALFAATLLLLGTGIVLTRIEGVLVVKSPLVRDVAYWCHVLAPLLCAWLFVLHRLAGKRIRWKVGLRWTLIAVAFARGLPAADDPRPARLEPGRQPRGRTLLLPVAGAHRVRQRSSPNASCTTTPTASAATGRARGLVSGRCTASASFNNPPYLAASARHATSMMKRDGSIRGARFCAGCHDPVPFFSGAVRRPGLRRRERPHRHAGITCTVCHAITHVNSPCAATPTTPSRSRPLPLRLQRQPLPALGQPSSWSRPSRVPQEDLPQAAAQDDPSSAAPATRCTCREELNDYKWLRGQNHYDSFLLSGVSGHGVQSFYYPKKAEPNCNGCHMPHLASGRLRRRDRDAGCGASRCTTTCSPPPTPPIPTLLGEQLQATPEQVRRTIAAHQDFNRGVMRVDLFGLRDGGRIDGELTAPLRPELPALRAGRDLPAGDRDPHGEDGAPVHPGHRRLQRGLAGPRGPGARRAASSARSGGVAR